MAANKLRVIDTYTGLDRAHTIWAGLIGGAFLAMASHGTDQLIVQRLLSAKNLRELVDYYDRRFDMKLSEADKQDLINFLGVL